MEEKLRNMNLYDFFMNYKMVKDDQSFKISKTQKQEPIL